MTIAARRSDIQRGSHTPRDSDTHRSGDTIRFGWDGRPRPSPSFPRSGNQGSIAQSSDRPETGSPARTACLRGAPRKHATRPRRALRALTPTICLLTALATLAGCDTPSVPPTTATTSAPATRDDEAPRDWPDFARWFEREMQLTPASVPLPEAPLLPDPQFELRRLDDESLLRSARLQTAWKPSSESRAALAQLGPFRSDQPGPGFVAARASAGRLPTGDSIALAMRGFRVDRERVGSIELELLVPEGREANLVWGRAGQLPIPVKSNSEPFTVRVLTDGFAEWTGPLELLQLVVAPPKSRPAEIRRVEFLPRENAYPNAINVARIRLGQEIRSGVYTHAPARITYPGIKLPAAARFSAGVGFVAPQTASAPAAAATVEFELDVLTGDQATTALKQTVSAAETWHDVDVDLSAWAGQNVRLELHVSAATDGVVAFWSNPLVYEPAPDAPLVVLYLIDTLAAEHMSLYGYPRATTPRIDALAAEGAWLDPSFSNASRTIESIPNLMFSLPVERHGVHHNTTLAPAGLVTLAESLRASGFATASFCTNVNAGPRQGMDQGFDTFVDQIGYYWEDSQRTIPVERVRDWIAANRRRPMFLYLHTAEPHAPYTPPESTRGRFDPDYSGPINGTYDPQRGFRAVRERRDLEHVVALYDEEILYADERFGAFLDQVDADGLRSRLRLVLTADHGEEFRQHGAWEHGLNLHNEQTRVPLVFYGFGPPRGRVAALAQTWDVLPTLLDALKLPPAYSLAGASLIPTLRDGAPPAARTVFLANHHYRTSPAPGGAPFIEYAAIRSDGWKLLLSAMPVAPPVSSPSAQPQRVQLFSLASDPRERSDLAAARPEIARALALELLAWRRAHPPYDAGETTYQLDAQGIRDLEAMGYVGRTAASPQPTSAPADPPQP